jgi:hypothetical protein
MLRSQASKPGTPLRVKHADGQEVAGSVFWPTE